MIDDDLLTVRVSIPTRDATVDALLTVLRYDGTLDGARRRKMHDALTALAPDLEVDEYGRVTS